MFKNVLKYFSIVIILTGLLLAYLSLFGIETNRFNNLIQNTFSKHNDKVEVKFDKVKILLNLSKLSISLKASDIDLFYDDKKIKLKSIKTNYSLLAFWKREFGIQNVFIESDNNNLKSIINFIRIYKNNARLIIFEKMLEKGTINVNLKLNFSKDGKIKNNYQIKGFIKDAEIRLLNNNILSNIDLNFEVQNDFYLFKNTKSRYKGIDLLSNEIKVIPTKNSNQNFSITGDINHKSVKLSPEHLSLFFKNEIKNFENIKLSSNNNFSLIIKKYKIKSYKVDTKIKLNTLKFKTDQLKIKEYFPSFKGIVDLKDHKVKVIFQKNFFSVQGEGSYLIDSNSEKITYDIKKLPKSIDFITKININETPINIEFLSYKKKENKDSSLFVEGEVNEKNFLLKKVFFSESKNSFLINKLNLKKNFKIDNIEIIDFDYVNNNKKKNKILLKRDKKNYFITGETFDAAKLLDEILLGDDKGGISRFFSNLNTIIKINLDRVFIGDTDFLKPLKSDIEFKKNNLVSLNLWGEMVDSKKLNLTIRTNEKNDKITTLFAENAKPLVKKYKFIKGFDEGSLDFYSIKKFRSPVSKSKLKIQNFKLKEVPVLTKILTLASLQGIADLLTGEGIRFEEFEMDFDNKKDLMTINEIYAIGPAISILMDGYVQGKNLVSLRGTLVPATTINKFIGSIPILGKILVGKKTGEGVFGVSFKIKGPPKNLKTTVNPIKTLTPRFITRTLEKIKKTEIKIENTP